MKYLINKNNCNRMKGGGYETYCQFCGGPTTLHNIYTIKNLKENKKAIKKEYLTNDYYYGEIQEKFKIIDLSKVKKYKWLEKLILLHPSGKNIKVEGVDTWDHKYKDKNGKEYFINDDDDEYLLHNDCYKLIKSEIGNFNFYNLSKLLKKKNMKIMKKYMRQEIPWLYFFYNQDDYLLESPLKNKKNKDRILDLNHGFKKDFINLDKLKEYYKWKSKDIKKYPMISIYKYKQNSSQPYTEEQPNKMDIIPSLLKLVENKDNTKTFKKSIKKDRPSPSESATKFKEGTKKKGNDGNMYIISVNKNGVKKWKKYVKDNK